MNQTSKKTVSSTEKHLQWRLCSDAVHLTRGRNSRDEGGKEIEQVDKVLLIHSDPEGAGVVQIADIQDQGHVTIPHLTGVVILYRIIKYGAEVV